MRTAFPEDPATVYGKEEITYGAVAALTWMAWDTIIHWEVEIDCIWRRPTSWIKFTYAFIRYFPIFHGGAVLTLDGPARFSTAGCRGWVYWELVFMELLTLAVELILVIRLYVLYNHNKIILWTIMLFFVAEITMMITALALVLPKMTFTADCLVAGAPGIFMAYWLSSLIFETFLFVLTLFKFFQSIRREYGKQSIMAVFVRDGTWAFAVIFVAMSLNLFLYKFEKTLLAGMGYYYQLSVMSFAGSHVLLNLRRLGSTTHETVVSMATMQFSGPQRRTPSTTLDGFLHTQFSTILPDDTMDIESL